MQALTLARAPMPELCNAAQGRWRTATHGSAGCRVHNLANLLCCQDLRCMRTKAACTWRAHVILPMPTRARHAWSVILPEAVSMPGVLFCQRLSARLECCFARGCRYACSVILPEAVSMPGVLFCQRLSARLAPQANPALQGRSSQYRQACPCEPALASPPMQACPCKPSHASLSLRACPCKPVPSSQHDAEGKPSTVGKSEARANAQPVALLQGNTCGACICFDTLVRSSTYAAGLED